MFSIDNLHKKRNDLEKEIQSLKAFLANGDPAHLMIRHHANGSYYYTKKYRGENGKWKDKIVKKELRFMKWEGASPKYLSAGDMEDIKKAADEGYIFARKVNDDHLRKEIEKVIL